jgi:hypothetical protein
MMPRKVTVKSENFCHFILFRLRNQVRFQNRFRNAFSSSKSKISKSDRFQFDNIGHERPSILFNFYPPTLAIVYMEVDTDLSLLVCPALARVGDGENVTRRGGDLADASPTRRVFQPHCTSQTTIQIRFVTKKWRENRKRA